MPTSVALHRIDSLRCLLGAPEISRATALTLEALGPDPKNKEALLAWLRASAEAGDGRYEIRAALRALTRVLAPRSYLEIGTRRGWSLAQVVAESPRVRAWCFDLWIEGYGDAENPGPDFVREELLRAAPGHSADVTFLSGNSHDLLPLFFQSVEPETEADLAVLRAGEEAPRAFDLITVDGDHTALGAWWDITDVLPFIAVGGALVFDDILERSDEDFGARAQSRWASLRPSPGELRPSLRALWDRLRGGLENFEFFECPDGIAPVGIAVRVR